MYLFGEISKKPNGVGAFTTDSIWPDTKAAWGKGAGLWLAYKTEENEVIDLEVGLSYTSIANAKANLSAEATGLSFAQAKRAAQRVWQTELGKLYLESDDETAKVKFYTGLYHALLGRGMANDVKGAYPKYDGTIGQLLDKDDNFYNTDAIWGAFRNLTQLWALFYPERYRDYVQTQLAVYKERGWFGDGIANSNFVSGVGTNFVGLAIAGAYQADIRGYDTKLAYEAIKANELNWKNRNPGSGKMDLEAFIERGFVPYQSKNKTDSTG